MRLFQIVIVMAILGFASSVAAEEIKKNYHESFSVEKGATLRLDHGDGNVQITPWDKNTIDIKISYHAEVIGAQIRKPKFEVSFNKSDNTVRVNQEESGSVIFGMFRVIEYEYEIKAPSDTQLKLVGSDGDIKVQNWGATVSTRTSDGNIDLLNINGNVDTKTSDGDIKIVNLYGNLEAHSSDGYIKVINANSRRISANASDGDISIENSKGDIDVHTSDGDISLKNIAAKNLFAKSSDGSLEATLLSVNNPNWTMKTSDGRIKVNLPKDVSAHYVFKTYDGTIQIDHPANQTTHVANNDTRGQFNSGRGKIDITTSDGNISLNSR